MRLRFARSFGAVTGERAYNRRVSTATHFAKSVNNATGTAMTARRQCVNLLNAQLLFVRCVFDETIMNVFSMYDSNFNAQTQTHTKFHINDSSYACTLCIERVRW